MFLSSIYMESIFKIMVMIDQSVYTDRHEIYLSTCVYSCPEILVSGVMLLQLIDNVCD